MPIDTYNVIILAQTLFVNISALTLYGLSIKVLKALKCFNIFSVVCKNYCYQEKILVNKQAIIEEQRAAEEKIVTQI